MAKILKNRLILLFSFLVFLLILVHLSSPSVYAREVCANGNTPMVDRCVPDDRTPCTVEHHNLDNSCSFTDSFCFWPFCTAHSGNECAAKDDLFPNDAYCKVLDATEYGPAGCYTPYDEAAVCGNGSWSCGGLKICWCEEGGPHWSGVCEPNSPGSCNGKETGTYECTDEIITRNCTIPRTKTTREPCEWDGTANTCGNNGTYIQHYNCGGDETVPCDSPNHCNDCNECISKVCKQQAQCCTTYEDCMDSDACTIDICNLSTHSCSHVAKSDGTVWDIPNGYVCCDGVGQYKTSCECEKNDYTCPDGVACSNDCIEGHALSSCTDPVCVNKKCTYPLAKDKSACEYDVDSKPSKWCCNGGCGTDSTCAAAPIPDPPAPSGGSCKEWFGTAEVPTYSNEQPIRDYFLSYSVNNIYDPTREGEDFQSPSAGAYYWTYKGKQYKECGDSYRDPCKRSDKICDGNYDYHCKRAGLFGSTDTPYSTTTKCGTNTCNLNNRLIEDAIVTRYFNKDGEETSCQGTKNCYELGTYNDCNLGYVCSDTVPTATSTCLQGNYITGNVFFDNDGDNHFNAGGSTTDKLDTKNYYVISALDASTGEAITGVIYSNGTYQVSFSKDRTYVISIKTTGADGTLGSGSSLYGGIWPTKYTVTVGTGCDTGGNPDGICDANGNVTNLNFAIKPAKSYYIRGTSFIDTDHDGKKDSGENIYDKSQLTWSFQGTDNFNHTPISVPDEKGTSTEIGCGIYDRSDGTKSNVKICTQAQCVAFCDGGSSCSVWWDWWTETLNCSSFPVNPTYSYSNNTYTFSFKAIDLEPNSRITASGHLTSDGWIPTEPALGAGTFTITLPCSPSNPNTIGNSKNASCDASTLRIYNLDFGFVRIVNPWIQSKGSDMRVDAGYNSPMSYNTLYASTVGVGGMPGIIFSGATEPYLGTGKISTKRWKVGSVTYPDLFTTSHSSVPTSYDNIHSAVAGNKLTITDINSLSDLPANVTVGAYHKSGGLTTDTSTYTFGAGKYIILIEGDLVIKGNIKVPLGSSVIFTVKGNIYVDDSVGVDASDATTTSIEGLYSADNSFYVSTRGVPVDCSSTPNGDKRLNIAGTVVANAGRTGGNFVNSKTTSGRNLCLNNDNYPSVYFIERPDFILNYPHQVIFLPNSSWQEVTP